MKINICTIDRNTEEGRQMIYWDTEDKRLHSELDPEDENGYPCETLEDAADMARELWPFGWNFEWIEYRIKPEHLDKWGEDAYTDIILNAGEIGAFCRGWDTTDYEAIMDQLIEGEEAQ